MQIDEIGKDWHRIYHYGNKNEVTIFTVFLKNNRLPLRCHFQKKVIKTNVDLIPQDDQSNGFDNSFNKNQILYSSSDERVKGKRGLGNKHRDSQRLRPEAECAAREELKI